MKMIELSASFASMAVRDLDRSPNSENPVKPFVKERSEFYKTNPFEVLPGEINHKIFKYALEEETVVPLGQGKRPALLKLNAAIYYPALHAFYAANEFGVFVPHYHGCEDVYWVPFIKDMAANIGLRKIRKRAEHGGIIPLDEGIVRTLSKVFNKHVRIHLSIAIEHPDPARSYVHFSFPMGDRTKALASLEAMRKATVSPDDCYLDAGDVSKYDANCLVLRSVLHWIGSGQQY